MQVTLKLGGYALLSIWDHPSPLEHVEDNHSLLDFENTCVALTSAASSLPSSLTGQEIPHNDFAGSCLAVPQMHCLLAIC